MELEYQDWTRLQGRGPHTGGRTAATTTSWGGGCGRVWGRTMILRWTPSWAHAGSASPKQWRLTVARIDQVGALPVHSPGPRPSAALRPCLCAVCLPSRQCGGSGICCRALVQIGGFSAKALSTGSFWAHAGTASPAQWRLKVARIDKVPCRCIRPRPSAAVRPCCVLCACHRASAVALAYTVMRWCRSAASPRWRLARTVFGPTLARPPTISGASLRGASRGW